MEYFGKHQWEMRRLLLPALYADREEKSTCESINQEKNGEETEVARKASAW